MVGFQTDRGTVDSSVGTLARQIQLWSSRTISFKEWLDTIPDADLGAPPYSYTNQEIALLRSSTGDMYTLTQIFIGAIDHTPASDLSVFVREVGGIPAVT
jgi:hypothetical protein